jgi:hypothetical protein
MKHAVCFGLFQLMAPSFLLMQRQANAYVIPAAVILGLALHNCCSSAYLLARKSHSAGQGWIWILSVITLLFIFGFITVQFMILDFITSPYQVSPSFPGLVQLLNYAFHLLSTIGISVVFMMRLSVFYDAKSKLMMVMGFLCLLVIASKIAGDGVGIKVSLSIMKNEYLRYNQHPLYPLGELILGLGAIADLLFDSLGSLGFLFALNQTKSNKRFISDILLDHDGYRFVMIAVLHALITSFMLYSTMNNNVHTFITHTGLYIPSWVYALEMHAFLVTSYVTAKEILIKQATSESKSMRPDSFMETASVFLDRYLDTGDAKPSEKSNTSKIPAYF